MESLPSPAVSHKSSKVVKPLSLLSKYQDHLAKINSNTASSTSRPPQLKTSTNRKLANLRLAQEPKPQQQQQQPKNKLDEHADKEKHQQQEQQQQQQQQQLEQQKPSLEQEVAKKESPKQDVLELEITQKETPKDVVSETLDETLEKSPDQLEQEVKTMQEDKPATSIHKQHEISEPVADPDVPSDTTPVQAPTSPLRSVSYGSSVTRCPSETTIACPDDNNNKPELNNPTVSTISLLSTHSATSSAFNLTPNITTSESSFMLHSDVPSVPTDQRPSLAEEQKAIKETNTSSVPTKSYIQHSVSSADKVPKHSISSSRLSRHLNVPTSSVSTVGTASPSKPGDSSGSKRSASSGNSRIYRKPVVTDHQPLASQLVARPCDRIQDNFSNCYNDDDEEETDSLMVNIMSLPKKFQHQQINPPLSSVNSPTLTITQASTHSSLLKTTSPPVMHNVWLDDDDDDDDDENDADDEQHEKFKLLKTDLFKKKTSSSSSKKKKKSVANADSYHSTAKSSSSGNTNVHESTLSSPPSASSKRKNSRRSFNFISGLAGNSETDSVLDKIKHSFSNKQESSRLDTIPAGVTSTSSSSFIGRRTSLMNLRSKTSQSTFMTDDTASIMTSSTSATNKRSSMMFAHSIAPTMSSISSHSLSTPNKHSGASASYKPQNSSAKSKLFGLLKGGNRSSHSSSGMGVNHVYGSPYTGASAGHNNESSFSHSSKAAALDKSKISSPLNFTHTAHAGASLFASEVEPVTTTTTMASTSTAMSSFHMPAPHRHDRVTMENESRRISTPPPTALASASAAVFTTAATTAALSSTSSSFVGSPNMGATSINDTGSISTTSVDDYSPISGSTKYHRAFFTQLNGVAAGSRLSFQGTESVTMLDDVAGNGLTPGAGAAGMISMPHRSIFKRQSVDSLASLERHIGPGSGNTNRYSLPPGMPFSSASLRARSRLSINSTLSVDSVVSSIDRMSTPPLPMPLVQPQVLPDGMALERVHEEGWF